MRIALDANLIVRYLVRDDEAQFLAAARVIGGPDLIYLPLVALCEAVWVLRRTYKRPGAEVARAIAELATAEGVEVDREALRAGLDMLSRGGDFADGCIPFEARQAQCGAVATFDRRFAKLQPGYAVEVS